MTAKECRAALGNTLSYGERQVLRDRVLCPFPVEGSHALELEDGIAGSSGGESEAQKAEAAAPALEFPEKNWRKQQLEQQLEQLEHQQSQVV